MGKSPCIGCKLEKEDKNNPVCKGCDKRIQYVMSIGPMTCSMPIKPEAKGFKMNKIKIRKCSRCGEIKPLIPELWVKNKRCTDGFEGICKACKNERSRKKSRRISEPCETARIELDFKDYPELFEKIKAVAKEEFRRPADQVMYWICKGAIKQEVS
jgi:hypothetical protein